MLGFIAFALFILVCSHWKFSSYGDDGKRDLEASEGNIEKVLRLPPIKLLSMLEENHLMIIVGKE